MLDLRRLDDTFAVAPQITADELSAIRAAGYRTVINNRPDGEEAGQPRDSSLRDAAAAIGLRYHAIPVGAQGIGAHELSATRAAMQDGPVLAFCRSGTRSCHLWALARAAEGDAPAEIVAKAADAGYDIAALAPTFAALAGK